VGRQPADPLRAASAALVVTAGDDSVIRWRNARTGVAAGTRDTGEPIQALALAAEAPLLLVASRAGALTLWGLSDGTVLGRFAPESSRWIEPGEARYRLDVVAGTEDGRSWLIGDPTGQVHVLAWCPDEPMLVPLELLERLRQIRSDSLDGAECLTAARALAAPDALDGLDHHARPCVVKALSAAVVRCEDSAVREGLVLALAEIDPGAATSACYQMFARWRDRAEGCAGRLLARVTGEARPTVEQLLARLAGADNLIGVLTSEALAAHGTAAVPALAAALRAFPPARDDSDGWMSDERTKYWILHALAAIGPAAAPAEATVDAVRCDPGIYRDTRWIAEKALRAMRRAE